MLRHLPLIFKNSVRNRRRSILTILSIAASLCLLGVLAAIYFVFYHSEPTTDQALRLIVRNRISLANPLPISYMAQIKQVPGVREAMIFQWFGGTYKDNRDTANFFARFGVEAEKLTTVYPEYRLPAEERQAFLSERTACLVGRKTASRLGFKVGDKIQLKGDIFPVNLDLTVRGIYDSEKDNENLLFHFEYLNEAIPRGRRDQVANFVIRMERPEDAASIANKVDDMFRNATNQTKTETEEAFTLSFLAFLGNVKAFLLAICGAVTFTILLVSGNTMAMSVRERVREVGILKTLGFTPGTILFLLVGEAVAIALAGGALGLLLAYGICRLMREAPSTFADFSAITLPPPIVALCLAVSALIGVVSSMVPAWSASRRSILDALREEE
jgi:putative ABC transport system permease protein